MPVQTGFLRKKSAKVSGYWFDIRSEKTIEREYTFDPSARYILTGLRRAGKSILLHHKVLELVESGVSWTQIIYINFEDERLAEFSIKHFKEAKEFIIVTRDQTETIQLKNYTVKVMKAADFLLDL